MIMMGQALDLSYRAIDDPGQFGLDVARYGSSETCCYRNRGGMIRQEFAHEHRDTMVTAGKAAVALNATFGHAPMFVDVIGVGGGVFDRLNEQSLPVRPFRSNEAPNDQKRYFNKRAEVYWTFRTALERGEIDLPPEGEDDKLIAQMGSIHFEYMSNGKIKIESKEDMMERGLPSPDRLDAVIMAWHKADVIIIPDKPPKDETLTGDLLERVW
jgi:hypothetical protein